MATRSSSLIFLPKPHFIVPCVNRIPYNLRIKYSLLPIDARSWSRCSVCHISRAVSSCARWISWSSSTLSLCTLFDSSPLVWGRASVGLPSPISRPSLTALSSSASIAGSLNCST
ncbi:MAP kinase-activating death domain protein [Trichinella spiralis]|uniref:MAP kinase-activating death domain protein n=1 Tax=Trichinella spiralis TaxID=6334 RepID=UPI0001EFBD6E|nr:MAP kinase-activating death domain protein [Trichinella spiralis]